MAESIRTQGTCCCAERRQQASAVLLAVSDNELRTVLRMLLEDAGYGVLEAHSGQTAYTLLLRSREPLVVLLERYLRGTNAVEHLLSQSEAGPLARHRFLLLMPDILERQPQSLRHHITSQVIPVLEMPFEFDDMLHEIAQAQSQLPHIQIESPSQAYHQPVE